MHRVLNLFFINSFGNISIVTYVLLLELNFHAAKPKKPDSIVLESNGI